MIEVIGKLPFDDPIEQPLPRLAVPSCSHRTPDNLLLGQSLSKTKNWFSIGGQCVIYMQLILQGQSSWLTYPVWTCSKSSRQHFLSRCARTIPWNINSTQTFHPAIAQKLSIHFMSSAVARLLYWLTKSICLSIIWVCCPVQWCKCPLSHTLACSRWS